MDLIASKCNTFTDVKEHLPLIFVTIHEVLLQLEVILFGFDNSVYDSHLQTVLAKKKCYY